MCDQFIFEIFQKTHIYGYIIRCISTNIESIHSYTFSNYTQNQGIMVKSMQFCNSFRPSWLLYYACFETEAL